MAKTPPTPAAPAPAAKTKKREPLELQVTRHPWPEPRLALYDPAETVGDVAQRFGEQQGLPGRYTFAIDEEALDVDIRMSDVPAGTAVELVDRPAD